MPQLMSPPTDEYFTGSTCRIEIQSRTPVKGNTVTTAKGNATTYFTGSNDEQDIIACSIHKMIGDPCGAFTIELVPRTQDWLKILRADDWVNIFMSTGSDGAEEQVMTGIIDTISRGRQVVDRQTGATRTTIHVAGRDVGKVLVETDPFVDNSIYRSIEGLLALSGGGGAAKQFSGLKSADEMLTQMLGLYFDLNNQVSMQFQRPDGTPFYKADNSGVLSFAVARNVDQDLKCIIATPPYQQQSIWDILYGYANTTINRLYIEMFFDVPVLTLEKLPFSLTDFAALKAVKLYKNETQNDTLCLSSHDVRNFFRVDSSVFTQGQSTNFAKVLGLGYLNVESIRRHGLKRLDVESLYASANDSGNTMQLSLQKMIDYITEWNVNNEELLSGQIRSRLRPDARLTKRLDFEDDDDEYSFIVQGYAHHWTYEQPSWTDWFLTRGVSTQRRPEVMKTLQQLITDGAVTSIQPLKSSTTNLDLGVTA